MTWVLEKEIPNHTVFVFSAFKHGLCGAEFGNDCRRMMDRVEALLAGRPANAVFLEETPEHWSGGRFLGREQQLAESPPTDHPDSFPGFPCNTKPGPILAKTAPETGGCMPRLRGGGSWAQRSPWPLCTRSFSAAVMHTWEGKPGHSFDCLHFCAAMAMQTLVAICTL